LMKTIAVEFSEPYSYQISNIRRSVFTKEQHIDPDMDFDGRDHDAVHVLIIVNGEYVGTGRMLSDGHIGRLAVLKEYRGKGFGAEIVKSLIEEAKKRKLKKVNLGAQRYAVGFYKKLGFSEYGEPYIEVNIEHLLMERSI
jgi:predicted GNAT family N-acyltransferase